MKRSEFLLKLDSLMERAPGTTQPSEILKQIESWDSLALMGFIAMVDSLFNKRVAGSNLAACKTIDDLLALVATEVHD